MVQNGVQIGSRLGPEMGVQKGGPDGRVLIILAEILSVIPSCFAEL